MTNYSFMVTNRASPTSAHGQEPLPNGGLGLYWATSQNCTNHKNFTEVESQEIFTQAIVSQLQSQTSPNLTVFIHGLDCFWDSAVKDTGTLGANLNAQSIGYEGLVIGFSWPSNGKDDLVHYASTYPQPPAEKLVRGIIAQSKESFGNFLAWLNELQSKVDGLIVNIVCHSEGNYLLMTGLGSDANIKLGQVLMLAADINDGAFLQQGDSQNQLIGQANAISTSAKQVTVYFTTNDPILGVSLGLYGASFGSALGWFGAGAFHNPSFGGRLGLMGPAYNQGPQLSNVASVDCSSILNDSWLGSNGYASSQGIGIHTSYFAVTQVIADIAATLNDNADMPGRSKAFAPNAYVVKPVTPA